MRTLFIAFLIEVCAADNNFLTGANDIIAVRHEDGHIRASPFSVQFGKKDIWLPRAGHAVSLTINGKEVGVSMVLDNEGRGYFSTKGDKKKEYRFWSAFLGLRDPSPKHRTDIVTTDQMAELSGVLETGANNVVYTVVTSSGSVVSTPAIIYLVEQDTKIVITDIDGTVTKSDVRGVVLPVLGLSDWKHDGVVKLYRHISDQGYLMMYLTNRAIGQSEMTRSYLWELEEAGQSMPRGPVLLQVESVFGALQTEVIKGQPEVNKIAALSKIRGLFPVNPFVAGFGNKPWDIVAYRALSIEPDNIYKVLEDSSLVIEGSGQKTSYNKIISNITQIFPNVLR